jgi:hypothetical protein
MAVVAVFKVQEEQYLAVRLQEAVIVVVAEEVTEEMAEQHNQAMV